MARRHDHLLRNLFLASLAVLALMHPNTVGRLAQLTVAVALAIVQGTADAAAQNPGAAAITGLALYAAHQIRTHRPCTAHAHH